MASDMTYREALVLRALRELLLQQAAYAHQEIIRQISDELAGQTKAEVVE